ncbi:glycosyltransferase family 4 protein [Ectothiorhodospiraceae bacterium 2226]|nr:glycosyltransferase family 4 protein [Ectothiorhodospiraceae bacterium 2226]
MGQGRLVYCKNGDVAAELAALGDRPAQVTGGPHHYIGTFLQWSEDQPVLLLSFNRHSGSHRTARARARTLHWGPRRNPLLGPFAKLRMFLTTAARILAFRPSWVLCAASGPPLWACYAAARMLGVPFVHTRHGRFGGGSRRWNRQLETWLDGWVILHAHAVICHGPYLREQLLALGVPRARLLEFNLSYRYLDAHRAPREAPSDAGGRTVLFVGRLQKAKGVFDLLEAMLPRLQADPRLRLVYAGGGPDLARLRERAAAAPCARQIEVPGYVPHDRVPTLVREARVVVTPTRAELPESRCKAAIESLVLGRPVIAPDAGPFPYVVRHGDNGLLFREHDVADLARQIGAALDDEALYARLLEGARRAGAELLDSSFNFRDALEAAYARSALALPAPQTR